MNLMMKLVFYILSLWDRSYDELLNEHRAYERRILIYTVMAIILILAAALLTPSIDMQPLDGIKYASYLVYKYIGRCALLLGTCSGIASFWNMAGIVFFRHKHGFTD